EVKAIAPFDRLTKHGAVVDAVQVDASDHTRRDGLRQVRACSARSRRVAGCLCGPRAPAPVQSRPTTGERGNRRRREKEAPHPRSVNAAMVRSTLSLSWDEGLLTV